MHNSLQTSQSAQDLGKSRQYSTMKFRSQKPCNLSGLCPDLIISVSDQLEIITGTDKALLGLKSWVLPYCKLQGTTLCCSSIWVQATIPTLFPPMRWPCKQRALTNGCYCRYGEEERPTVVPPAQASGVSLEGYATLVGLDDTLQRDNNMRSHKPL